MRCQWVVLALVLTLSPVRGQEALTDMFGMIGDLAGSISDGCPFKCPSGAAPVRNPNHKPSSNGCGSYGIKVDLKDYPEMTSCCNSHDYCYDTCGEDKQECDEDFRRCLQKICKRMKKKGLLKDNQFIGCKSTVELIYGGLLTLGCDAYLKGQKQACTCPANAPNTPGAKDEF